MRLERLLHDWECSLPQELQIPPGTMALPAKNVILLHAQFQNCRLLLHRPLYSLLGDSRLMVSVSTSARRSESPPSMSTGTTNEAHVACTAAAGAIAHLVTLFKQHGWRSASPLFIYYVFSAGIPFSKTATKSSNNPHLRCNNSPLISTNRHPKPANLFNSPKTHGCSLAISIKILSHDRRGPETRYTLFPIMRFANDS